ncbi:MAG TPA: OmpA family protein, partial [Polyangiaceae bacterium]|nr:OmpA family protein [Polyangiaceae bacterium]
MVDVEFKQKESAGKSFSLPVNARHQVKLTPPTVEVLDVEDSHFNFDRKVLLPELSEHDGSEPVLDTRRITGLGVIYAALSHAREHADQGLVVTGHTDASGTASYNQKLSEERAKNVSLLLRGEREQWRTQAAADDSVDDYQAVLLWQHQRAGWDCDPGAVNNQLNVATKRAIGRFQELYNAEVDNAQSQGLDSPFKSKITVDKKVGKETWGAIYDVYMSELMELLELENFSELEAIQKGLKAAPGMTDFVGCGEHIPFNPARRTPSKSNGEHDGPPKNPPDRRVEILFFDPGEEVPLACHPAPGQCKPDVCPLYTLNPHRQQPIAVPKGLSIAELNLRLTYVDPEGNVRPFPEGLEVEAKFGDPKDDPGPPEPPPGDITLDPSDPKPAEPAPTPTPDPNAPESMEVDQEPNEKIGADGLLRMVIPRK